MTYSDDGHEIQGDLVDVSAYPDGLLLCLQSGPELHSVQVPWTNSIAIASLLRRLITSKCIVH
jgi:hypothetical protein